MRWGKLLGAKRGGIEQVGLVAPVLVFIVLVGLTFAQRIQVGGAVEAAAREAARYVAANSVFDGSGVFIPGNVRVEAERRAREIVARNVNLAARGAPGGAVYYNISVDISSGYYGPGGYRPDYVVAKVTCRFFGAASIRGGQKSPAEALAPGREWAVTEIAVFRVPGYVVPDSSPAL